ncbi:putative ribonuclease H-like superfamily, hAT-like transposase, RNase-H [Helianthus annuus]|nr:putative ribonuclease H-like superfamily, hAT-like transposase, RNase-H [Helianthus annuus]KAJ0474859.1 putative ribonuclease H-like superfamily, hAT-like transposase, RNase-H [Helianthus annuus]KAJ0650415.1 putative ribonuclease H-like superfamily, hAT-like transposase, RNase-H [Helianthus annuus]KAJ0654177.1 putative ribonuclease H-like superfamily, hAT-like transposase, RNase-H [Helianthus annuus]
MAKEMKKKFDKYYKSYSMVLSFAVVLDPRYKFKLVEFCFKKLNMTEEERKTKVDIIFKGMHKLYDMEYGILSRKTSSTAGVQIFVVIRPMIWKDLSHLQANIEMLRKKNHNWHVSRGACT